MAPLPAKTGAAQVESVPTQEHKQPLPQTIEELEKLTDAQVVALAKQEGIDIQELREILMAGRKMPAFLQDKKSATVVPREKPELPTLDQLIEQNHRPLSEEELKRLSNLYFDKTSESVPEAQPALLEIGKKYAGFIDKHVRGRKVEVAMLVGFLLYRQATWIFNAWLVEQHGERKVNQFSSTPLGSMLGVIGMDARWAEGLDLLIRCSFCGTRLWIDISNWYRTFRHHPEVWAHQPDVFLQDLFVYIQRAQRFFSDPLYYGAQLSLLKRILVGMALPLTWFSVFANRSPGHALGDSRFKGALNYAFASVQSDIGHKLDRLYDSKIKESTRHKLFKYSGGILRERLFLDITSWVYRYGRGRYISNKNKGHFGTYMARRAGKYTIKHAYTHGVIELLKIFCRHGGLQAGGWLFKQFGALLSKMGFFRKNPFSLFNDGLKALGVKTGLLKPEQDVHELLTYVAAIFPGALVRSVKQHVPRQDLPAIEKYCPDFVNHLNNMNGLSPYDILRMFAYNPFVVKTMADGVSAVRQALPAATWAKVSRSFYNEMMIDAFLNRERMVCQLVTEPIIARLSKPVLHKMYEKLLPDNNHKK